ncbi:glycosyltransferase family 39 protein [Micromonospora olivasterospora]|uniref:Dolichyl-phosphate-mannose-protein mannosyltransferase n=1 Tax=Micromonospora olivasterospora TaxID=1880 RepID=A0A562IEC0_MICOL|nr:glycosyltransferase family 39 protein [Micromonospora olivasterospora]TWH69242.1 dolichyl-phosphate-mannose-protein mannosyltransferase [Micromonospora olivasterospora]
MPAGRLTARRAGRALADLPRRHLGLVLLLAAGLALRVAMMVAYRPALWFQGDSGGYIRRSQQWPELEPRWPFPWLIKAFEWTGTLASVAAVQHLAGLALGVAAYLLLRRLGVGPWLAALAAAPLLLDATQLTLEHYLLTETLFTAAVAVAALLLVRRERPGPATCLGAGVAVALGMATRPTGIVAVAPLLVFLALPWRGWPPPVAYLLGIVAFFGAVFVGTGTVRDALGLEGGKFLYGRTAQIADCDRLELRPGLRKLCPTQPLDQRPERPDWFIWTRDSPIRNAERPADLDEFAREVIRQQPGDYLAKVASDTARYFWPTRLGPAEACLASLWRPRLAPTNWAADYDCTPRTAGADYRWQPTPSRDVEPNAASRIMQAYGRYAVTPPPVLAAATLIALLGAAWPRRGGLRLSMIALLYAAIGAGIMVFSVATSMFDLRYGLPALAFLPIAAAVGWQRLRSAWTDRPPPVDSGSERLAPTAESNGKHDEATGDRGHGVVAVPQRG